MIWTMYLHLSSYQHLDLKTIKVRLKRWVHPGTSADVWTQDIRYWVHHRLNLHAPPPPLYIRILLTLSTHIGIRSLLSAYLSCCHPLFRNTHEVSWVLKALGMLTWGVSSCTLSPLSHCTWETTVSFWRQTSEVSLLGDSQLYFLQNQIFGCQLSTVSWNKCFLRTLTQ